MFQFGQTSGFYFPCGIGTIDIKNQKCTQDKKNLSLLAEFPWKRRKASSFLGVSDLAKVQTMYEMQVCFFDTTNPGFY